jgi:endonuclease YncB( thermonuclease family)
MQRIPRFLVILALFIAQAPTAGLVFAETIVGRASVIDGDTLEIRGKRIRLHGIDAPESGQTCLSGSKRYRCGQRAALALSDKIGRSNTSCEARDRDRYGRVVAICRSRGEDLNGWMVSQGWALAYRRFSGAYVQNEGRAKRAKLGVWQGQFIAPWDWRRGKRLAGSNPPKQGRCVIKGNISRRGTKIYHVPGGQYYDRTRINPSKGERWFCSEAEARAAGWRRSKR